MELNTKMTKKAIIERCDNIRKSQELKKPVIGEDAEFLLSIFKKHSQWEVKSETGIRYITVEKVLYGTRSFVLVRNDNKRVDISPKQCISPDNDITRIKKACRNAIYPEIKKMKDGVNFGVDRCPFTKEILYKENTHIDHFDLKFHEVFNNWIADKNIKLLTNALNKENGEFARNLGGKIGSSMRNGVIIYFTDENIVSDFVDFHNKNTHLRAVSKTANLEILK